MFTKKTELIQYSASGDYYLRGFSNVFVFLGPFPDLEKASMANWVCSVALQTTGKSFLWHRSYPTKLSEESIQGTNLLDNALLELHLMTIGRRIAVAV